jgi:ATP/maltotriose-dependent transcriptional regulator MalT
VNASVRAEALQLAAAYALWWRGDAERARALTEDCLALTDELSDTREIAYRLQGAGQLLRAQGDYARAIAVLDQALSMFRELDNKGGLGVVLIDLANVAREQGDVERLIKLSEEGLGLCREVDNRQWVAYALRNLGEAARTLGDLDRARALCEEALELNENYGSVSDRAEVLASLASVVRDQGALDEAEALLAEGLRLSLSGAGDIRLTATSLEGMAGLEAARGRAERAAALFGAAHALRQRIKRPIWQLNRPSYEIDLTSAREALGVERFTRMWEEGHAMTVDQAIACALDETPGRSPTTVDSR